MDRTSRSAALMEDLIIAGNDIVGVDVQRLSAQAFMKQAEQLREQAVKHLLAHKATDTKTAFVLLLRFTRLAELSLSAQPPLSKPQALKLRENLNRAVENLEKLKPTVQLLLNTEAQVAAETEARFAAMHLPSVPTTATSSAGPAAAAAAVHPAAAAAVNPAAAAAAVDLSDHVSPAPLTPSAPATARTLLSSIVVQPWGVLGEAASARGTPFETTRAAPAPDAHTLFCDPANCSWLQDPSFHPTDARGASGAIYRFLLLDKFPTAVSAAMRQPTDAVYHRYPGDRLCIHVGSPRLSSVRSEAEALKLLVATYTNILLVATQVACESAHWSTLRLLPVSSGIFAGSFGSRMPSITARALAAAAEAAAQQAPHCLEELTRGGRSIELCVFDPREVPLYRSQMAAGGRAGGAAAAAGGAAAGGGGLARPASAQVQPAPRSTQSSRPAPSTATTRAGAYTFEFEEGDARTGARRWVPLTDAGVVAELERLRSGAADEVRYRARGQAYRATRSGDGFFVQMNEATKVARMVRAVGFRF